MSNDAANKFWTIFISSKIYGCQQDGVMDRDDRTAIDESKSSKEKEKMKYLGVGLLVAIAFLVGVHAAPMIPGAALAQRQTDKIQWPRAWGKVVGSGPLPLSLMFEANDGTLRLVTLDGNVVVIITRN